MRRLRVVLTLIIAGAALVKITTSVWAAAQPAPGAHDASQPARLEQDLSLSLVQTVTLEAAPDPFAAGAETLWEKEWGNFPSAGGFHLGPHALPADFAGLTIVGANYLIETNISPKTTYFGEVYTNRVFITATPGSATVYMRYRTNSRAMRTAQHYRVGLFFVSDLTTTYRSTILFDNSIYRYAGFANATGDTVPALPQTADDRVWWGPLTYGVFRFGKEVYFADMRLPVLYLPSIAKNP